MTCQRCIGSKSEPRGRRSMSTIWIRGFSRIRSRKHAWSTHRSKHSCIQPLPSMMTCISKPNSSYKHRRIMRRSANSWDCWIQTKGTNYWLNRRDKRLPMPRCKPKRTSSLRLETPSFLTSCKLFGKWVPRRSNLPPKLRNISLFIQ